VSRLLKVMKAETYVIIVKDMKEFAAVKAYKAEAIDEHTIEVELTPADTLNDLLAAFTKDGFTVTDFRPKGHRLEKLFLSLLKE
jgi:hypothetical protein